MNVDYVADAIAIQVGAPTSGSSHHLSNAELYINYVHDAVEIEVARIWRRLPSGDRVVGINVKGMVDCGGDSEFWGRSECCGRRSEEDEAAED